MSRCCLSKPRWLALLPLIAILAVAVACGGAATATPLPAPTATPQPEAEPEVIKIGMLVALTGLASGIGIPQVVAAEMSADRIAAEGGLLVGGKRYNFEILSIDAPAEEPERARTGASRFVFRDNVKFISPSGDPADSAASTVTEDEKVIVFGGSGNAPLYGEKDYMMNCHSTAMFFADAYYAKLIEENPDWNRWVYLQINGNWDQVAVPYSERAIKNLGKEWLGIQVVDQGTVDFTPSVSGVLSKDPDVIIVGQFVGSAPPLMKTIREMGWDGPMVSGVNTYLSLPEIMKGLEGVEEYAEGFTQVDYAHFPPTAEGQAFIDEYKSRRGGEFNPYAFGAWWALETLFAALQAAGTVDDPDAIMAAYEKVQVRYPFYEGEWVNGSGGKETFGKDRICETPQAFSVIRNGEPVSLDIIIPHIP